MSKESTPDLSRRQFITGAAAAVASLTLAPGVFLLRTAGAGTQPGARWGILVDTNLCGDCNACVTACHKENGVGSMNRPRTDAQWIRKVEITDRATGHTRSLPVMCQHCETPPCVDVCPTGASFKSRRRHRAGEQAHLHRLPLLHDGLPLQGAFLHSRTPDRSEAPRTRAARARSRAARCACTASTGASAPPPAWRPATRRATARWCSGI
jgi:ferredoxin